MLSQNYCIHATDLLVSSAYVIAVDLTVASDTVCGNHDNWTAVIYASTNWHTATVTYLEIDTSTFADYWYVAVVEGILLWNVIQKQNH